MANKYIRHIEKQANAFSKEYKNLHRNNQLGLGIGGFLGGMHGLSVNLPFNSKIKKLVGGRFPVAGGILSGIGTAVPIFAGATLGAAVGAGAEHGVKVLANESLHQLKHKKN